MPNYCCPSNKSGERTNVLSCGTRFKLSESYGQKGQLSTARCRFQHLSLVVEGQRFHSLTLPPVTESQHVEVLTLSPVLPAYNSSIAGPVCQQVIKLCNNETHFANSKNIQRRRIDMRYPLYNIRSIELIF